MNARKSFFWAAAGQVLSFFISFAGSVVVARILTPTEVGTYVLGAAFAGLCSAATAFNIGAYIVGEANLSRSMMDCAFTLNALLALALSFGLTLGGFYSSAILGSAPAGQVMFVLALQPALGALTFRPVTMLHREMQFRTVALINVSAAFAGTAVTVASAIAGQSFMSQAWGAITVSVVSALGFLIVGARYISLCVSLKDWREIAVFGLRMTTISGAAMATARLSEVILGRVLGLHALGIFSRASNLSNQLWENVYGTATRVAFAQLSKDFRESGELRSTFLHSFRLIAGVMCPLIAGLAVLSPVMISLLYGNKWLPAALPLSLLLVAQIIAIGFGMNWELFVIRRETARQTRIELVRNVVGLVSFSVGCLFSVASAAVGRILDNSVGLLLYRKHVLRLSGASAAEVFGIFKETLILTLLAVLPAAVLMVVHHWSHATPPAAVMIAIMAGIGCWYLGLLVLDHPLGQEIKLLGMRIIRMGPLRRRAS